jgi:hypothetical protein
MPDCRIVKIHKKLQELIGVSFAAGFSGIDMSGRVVRGMVDQPPMVPFSCIRFDDAIEDYGPTMGRYSGNAIFEIYCFIGGSSFQERGDQALNLSSDIISAITANRSLALPSEVDDVKCDFTAIDGDKVGLNNIGIGYIRVTVKFQSDNGV